MTPTVDPRDQGFRQDPASGRYTIGPDEPPKGALSDGRRCVSIIHVFEKGADGSARCQCGTWTKANLEAANAC